MTTRIKASEETILMATDYTHHRKQWLCPEI